MDLGRRLLNGGDVDFVMLRLRQINCHLLHFEQFSEIMQSISAVIVCKKVWTRAELITTSMP